MNQAVLALAALSQEARLRIFRLLVRSGEEGMPAGAIAEALDVPAATLSFHLKELLHAGLVQKRRAGRSLIYSLCPDEMRALIAYLLEDCCQGRPELCHPDFDPEHACDPCAAKGASRSCDKTGSP